MAILGLLGTQAFAATRFKNIRRSVYYFYPNGAAPLTGLLTMLPEEDTNDPEFFFWEKRKNAQRTTLVANVTGPFADVNNNDLANPFNATVGQLIHIAVTDSSFIRIGHVVRVTNAAINAGNPTDVVGIVTNTFGTTTPQRVEVQINKAVSSIDNGGTNNIGAELLVIGSAFSQGSLNISQGIYNVPVKVGNFCQIFRTPFSMTRTAMRTAVQYDESGAYRDLAKENSIYHMTEMEKGFLFGWEAIQINGVTQLPTYTTGGILWYLAQWELGTVYGNSPTAIVNDTDDQKRIISNTASTLTESQLDGYYERLFRVTNNVANEKLAFVGSGFLNVLNQLYKSKAVFNSDIPMEDTYGMNVTRHRTPFGDVYYKTHPLFSENPTLRFNGLFLDIHNLKYRYVQGGDTDLLKNRQPNDADYRTDEWLSECGLELRMPESHLYLQNVQAAVV